MLDFKEMVIENRSYRTFDPTVKVSPEELNEMIECARLSPSAANRQPLKYRPVLDGDELELMNANTKWAGLLPDIKLPPEGKTPRAYIVILRDTAIAGSSESALIDIGIAAEAILLSAVSLGLGGCMIGAFDRDAVSDGLSVPDGLVPELVIAIGRPAEISLVCGVGEDGSTKYFRDSKGLHFVPKRSLDEVTVKKS